MSCLLSDSAGTSTFVRTVFESVVSDAPPALKVTLLRLSTVRAGPGFTCTWKVTDPVAPGASAPKSTTTTPLPAGAMEPASSPPASVRGAPFQRIVPGT